MSSSSSSTSTAYTPLESLLLFQALRAEGVNSHAIFNRISDQLQKVNAIRNDPTYDSGRLSPDALRELYLWLLKEEVKRDLERQNEKQALLLNGSLSPNSRKRKAPSPTLPTVHEAGQHAHLIPQLVSRLYARYREHAVRETREQERRYALIKREIGEIEEGKWDERLQRQRGASQTQSPRPSAITQLPSAAQHGDGSRAAGGSPTPSGDNATAPPKPFKGNKIGDVINHGPEAHNASNNHRRTSSGTVLPPLSEMAPQSPRFGIPPKGPGPLSTQIPNTAYRQSPPSGHQSPYSAHGHPHPSSMASAQVQQSLSRPSSSPRPVLPPPPGMKLPPPSPGPHVSSPVYGGPQCGQPMYAQHHQGYQTAYSPANERPPPGYPPQGSYQGTPQHYWQQHAGYGPPTSYGQPPPMQHAAYQQQYYSAEPKQPYNQQRGPPMHSASHTQHYAPPHYPQSAPGTAAKPARPADPLVSGIISALVTPPRVKRNNTFKRLPSNLQTGMEMPSPVAYVEPNSPVLKRSEPAGRSTRSNRNRDNNESEPSVEPETTARSTRARGRAKRERSPHSVISSVADDSTRVTRSQSVSTAGGRLHASDDRPLSRGNVKLEPSTPAADSLETPDPLPNESHSGASSRMTRNRRNTLQQPSLPTKRTRNHSPSASQADAQEEETWSTPPPRPTTIQATRNFHKMSATLMNDINSHRHASYFAQPVRDKDAPGYSEIVKVPQDLKSIRLSIAAGAKAVNAAVAAASPSASSSTPTKVVGGDSGTVELERTLDLIPPRAIVNAAQLEKEILRVFANAVMFNPGEDGMVRDTKEMFEDVEGSLASWRGAEREMAEKEESVAVDEDVGRGKRRKV